MNIVQITEKPLRKLLTGDCFLDPDNKLKLMRVVDCKPNMCRCSTIGYLEKDYKVVFTRAGVTKEYDVDIKVKSVNIFLKSILKE